MKAIYPGTFDPFSLGHLDIAERASKMYVNLLIAVSENHLKKPMFTFSQRIEMARIAVQHLDNVSVIGFSGLLVDTMRDYGILHVIRGIRGMVDFEYEFQMAQVNRNMLKGYESVFLIPGAGYMVLNSTFIRELLTLGGDVSYFLPDSVHNYIKPIMDIK